MQMNEATLKKVSHDWVATAAGLVLVGGECVECGRKFFPVKQCCPGCGGDQVSAIQLARSGNLYSYSVIHSAPRGFKVPYSVGFVDLEDGVRVFGQIDGDPAELELDGLMEPVFGTIREGDAGSVEGYKFRRVGNVA
jgi:uncharacterized OB-fold protein